MTPFPKVSFVALLLLVTLTARAGLSVMPEPMKCAPGFCLMTDLNNPMAPD